MFALLGLVAIIVFNGLLDVLSKGLLPSMPARLNLVLDSLVSLLSFVHCSSAME